MTPAGPDGTVTATLHRAGTRCQEEHFVGLTELDQSLWELLPQGPADRDEVRPPG